MAALICEVAESNRTNEAEDQTRSRPRPKVRFRA